MHVRPPPSAPARRRRAPHAARTLAALLPLLVAAGCDRAAPVPPAPPPERAHATFDAGSRTAVDPEPGLPLWRRTAARVLDDARDARPLQPGTELRLPIPEGARALTTSVAVPQSGRVVDAGTGADAQTAAARAQDDLPLTVELWRVRGGERTRLASLATEVVRARQDWIALTARLDPAAARGEELVASVTGRAVALEEPLWTVDRPRRLNVLIVSIDTLRADHLSCYGYARDTSPSIDALAAAGTLFEDVVSPAPWTLPSYGSLFTSRTPARHRAGVRAESEIAWGVGQGAKHRGTVERLDPDLPTLAGTLGAAGWSTAGFQSNPFLSWRTGIDRGFQRWVYYLSRAATGVDLALEWIESRRGAPWFAFVHMIDPHAPYTPPPPFDRRFSARGVDEVEGWPPDIAALRRTRPDPEMQQQLVDFYDGEIAYADEQVGRLIARLAEIGELEHTLVVLHSDHGEEFWDHGGYEHGHTLHTELLRVPLILRLPGRVPAGARVASRVRALDVMPTVLEIVGVAPPGELRGESLVPAFGGAAPARPVFSEALLYGLRESKALTAGTERYVLPAGGPGVLYDLAQDPGETRDLAAERPARVERLRGELLERHRQLTRAGRTGTAAEGLDDKHMRDLGYAGEESAGRPR